MSTLLAAGDLRSDLTLTYPRDLDARIAVRMADASEALAPAATPDRSGFVKRSQLRDVDLADVAERAIAATVTIYTASGLGSGFLVHADGLVVTGCHVIVGENGRPFRTVQVRLADDTELEGTIWSFHRRLDFALLWLSGAGPFPTLSIGDPKRLRSAETVLAIGSPSALRNTVSRGIVSNPRQLLRGVECIQTDAFTDHGNSGGPLVNWRGEAVGINLWILGDLDTGKFALPIDFLTFDLRAAVLNGRAKCLEVPCCPHCGHPEFAQPTWFCRNCGVRQNTDQEAVA